MGWKGEDSENHGWVQRNRGCDSAAGDAGSEIRSLEGLDGFRSQSGSRWALLAEGWWNLGRGRTREDDELCSGVNGTVSRGQEDTAGGTEERSGLG